MTRSNSLLGDGEANAAAAAAAAAAPPGTQILSEAKDPLKVQPFVKKCFEAVKEFTFEKSGEISGMLSVEGEKIQWIETVNPAATGACRTR